jgi:L-alanine-DL-glutamate epimerase-like enolase superfamily enzyme
MTSLRIESIDVHNLYYRYPDDAVYRCAEGHMGARLTSIVQVRCSGGVTGVGSAYSHPGIVRLVVEDHLAPFLVGRDPTRIDELWDLMYSLTRWYGRKGAAISALGAVDMALWDIRGKVEGAPVYRLLGGADGRVHAYASGLLWQDEMSLLEREALRHVADGFRLMKMRLGRDPDYDRAAVDTVTSVLGGHARLAVDGTHRYTEDEAADFAGFLRDRGVVWFEEPFPPEDVDAYARLRSKAMVPVAAGENEFGLQGFRELLRVGTVDIAQPDASRTGGITEAVRIGSLAAQHDVRVVTHTWSDAVALVANAHVVAALQNGMAVEVDRTGCPFMDGLLLEPPRFSDGNLVLPERPGLGIEVDTAFITRLEVPAGRPFPAGNYADMVFGGESYAPVPPAAFKRKTG